MKAIQKILSGLLAGLFSVTVLAGCSVMPEQSQPEQPAGETTAQSLTGGYVEEEISPDHNHNVGLYAVGNTLHAFTIENSAGPISQQIAHWYTLDRDGSWQENPDNGFADAAAQVGDAPIALCRAYLTGDSGLYWWITVIQEDADKTSQSYLFQIQDGKATLLETPPAGEVALWTDDTVTAIAVCGDSIVTMNNDLALHGYDSQGNPVQMEFPDLQGRLLCGTLDGFYWMDDQNDLQHCLIGGTTIETVLDGSRYSLTSPGLFVSAAAAIGNDAIFIQMSDGNAASQNQFLYRYRWDDTVKTDQSGELTVFSLYHSRTVDAAVDEMIKQTGVQVSYTYALEESSENGQAVVSGSREDALTQLNTQLLAGGGPDVIVLDDMPVQSMIDKGVLADLTGKVNTEGLLDNMAGVWRTEQGLFAVPVRCFPMLFGGADEVMNTIPDAETLAERLAAEPNLDESEYDWQTDPIPLMSFRSTAQLFDTFYPLYANAIWRDGSLDEEAYRAFLEQLGRICQGGGSTLRNTEDFSSGYSGTSYYTPSNGTSGGFMNAIGNAFCDSIYSLNEMGSNFQYYSELSGIPTSAEVRAMTTAAGQSCIQPSCVAGINASSANADHAAQFLGILLDQTVQEQTTYDGCPVLVSAVQTQWQEGMDGADVQSATDITAVLQEMDVVQPSTVLRTAAGQGAQLYLGGGDLNQAVQTARDAAALWLAEQ